MMNHDPLEWLLKKELTEGPVAFDEWEDALDALADEPEDEPLPEGMRFEQALQAAQVYRADFLAALESRGLPFADRLALCRGLAAQAEQPTDELRRLYSQIVCDTGFLLDPNRAEREPDEDVNGWLRLRRESDALYEELTARAAWGRRFAEILAQTKKTNLLRASYDPALADRIFQAYDALFSINTDEQALFFDNLCLLLEQCAGASPLHSIAPLYLYRVLTRHAARLRRSEGIRLDGEALWTRQEYLIDEDNGKNFRQNDRYLKLFEMLCSAFRTDPAVDLSLCGYGFERISNLGEFYRRLPENKLSLPLPRPLSAWLEENPFSCFARGYEDNLLLTEGGIDFERLLRFESDPRYARALSRISDFMNRHGEALAEDFYRADAAGVRALCGDILAQSGLRAREQPADLQELAFFLASINGGLMELVDYFAEEALLKAGDLLST